jgi:hypothetical protein
MSEEAARCGRLDEWRRVLTLTRHNKPGIGQADDRRLRREDIMRLAHLAPLARHVIWAALLAATPALAQQPLKIGLIMPYTGQFTDASAQMDDAIKLYVKQHGDTIAGRKIEFIRRDDSGSPDVAKRMARELTVNDNVDILAGFVITPEAPGPTRAESARSTPWCRTMRPATTPRVRSSAPSRRQAARSSARCAFRSPIRISQPSSSA